MVDRDDTTNDEHTNEGPRKRRLFGSRRSARKTEGRHPAAEHPVADAAEQVAGAASVPAGPASVETGDSIAAPAAPAGDAGTERPTTDAPTAKPSDAGTKRGPASTPAASTPAASARPADAEQGGEAQRDPARAQTPANDAIAPSPVITTASAKAPGLPSSALIFQAPPALPALPALEHDDDEIEDEAPASRRRTRKRGERGTRDDSAKRQREPELITEPQKVKGSTRLEAKKQRRRDGRDAGRRRQVITEAEFLARRESVDRKMIVRSKGGRIQIGVLEDGVLVEHYVARSQEASLIGNVYLGRVQNVLPSMEAAFVDIGRGRNAVLYSGEVDWDAADAGNQPRKIELALKPGDKVLVQVTKDPVGHKGARLTSQVSLPGRYLVYVPNGSMNGISRKLPDTERARLKKILKEVLPENVGVIVRTAAEGATQEQLTLDVNRLTAQWADISKQVETVQAPAMLHSEPDLLIKIVRDVFNEDFQKMVIAGSEAQATIENYLRQVAPDLLERVEKYEGDRDAFDEYRITEQIEKALDRKVWLPSGGSLIIDRTEAMTVIDVNTGKFVGSGGNLEETVTKNNLEAAEEIVRQLRLRDIGGIIVVDFIDMVLESNRDLVLRRLVECLSRDRTKHQVAEVTSLGLVQMTRKKLGLGLLETFSEPCEVCAGRGVVVHHDPVTKHRSSNGQNERRRGKGNSSNGQHAVGSSGPATGQTHAITDDAKNALAQIAASTILHQAEAEQERKAEHDEQGGDAGTSAPAADHEVSERAPAGASVPDAKADQATADKTASIDAAQPTVAILDIPVALPAQRGPKIDSKEAEQLLDSVLDALPEPKQPGQGRGRSRRVTTAALTGTAVTPRATRDES